MRKLWLLMVSYWLLVPTVVWACLPAPFKPEGTKVERAGESRAFLTWDKGVEYLVIDPQLRGTAKDFGLALAFPAKPEVAEAPPRLFEELQERTKPLPRPEPPAPPGSKGLSGAEPPGTVEALPVELIETKEVGEFTVSILTATDAQALLDWLNKHGYTVTQQDLENFNYYVKLGGYYFAALKINPHKVSAVEEAYKLSPIEFSFPNEVRPMMPLRLARDQDPPQKFTLYTLGDPPLVVYGAQILYNKEILIPSGAGESLYVKPPPASLARYNPDGKWLTRQEFTIDPAKIERDLDLTFWSDAYPIHIMEGEASPTVLSEFTQADAGVIKPAVWVRDVKNYIPGYIPGYGLGEPVLPHLLLEEGIWEQIGLGIGFGGVFFVYLALALRSLAKKYGAARRWRAWVPLAQWFLLVDIAGKPKIWKHYVFLPLVGLFAITLGTVWAILAALAFFLWQIMLALCITAIARRQKYPMPLILGLAAAFAQPLGALILGVLAWGKRV